MNKQYLDLEGLKRVWQNTKTWTNATIDTKIGVSIEGLQSKIDKNTEDISNLAIKVDSITGAMRFRGKSTTDPTQGFVTIDGVIVSDFKKGDVVLYESKEYVFVAEKYTGVPGEWELLGDGTSEEQKQWVNDQISQSETKITDAYTAADATQEQEMKEYIDNLPIPNDEIDKIFQQLK